MITMDLETSILNLKGIGEKSAKLFNKLGIFVLGDLLEYYPRGYERFEAPANIEACHVGEMATFKGTITAGPTLKHVRNLTILNYTVADRTGQIFLTFFNMPYLKNTLKKGSAYIFRGMLQNKAGKLVIEQAKLYKEEEFAKLAGMVLPHYPLTKGITNQAIIKAVKQALSAVFLTDPLPEKIRKKYDLMTYRQAMENIHFPANMEILTQARKRLAFDELFFFILLIRKNKDHNKRLKSGRQLIETADTGRLLETLPYQLTNAQMRVWEEIRGDLTGEHVMNRLVQGDVGSGKTILAFLALLLVASNGCQGALMAPTEVLARQHFDSLTELSKRYHLPFRPVLLTGSVPTKQRREAYSQIETGEVNVVIGTHALIQEKVVYHHLALVVTDEQHRFGVRQRETFSDKGEHPHILVMSATPIPRTLAIILYGDLDISVVDELPANRLPIKNCVVGTQYRPKAYQFIAKEVAQGHQVYCICPMVEPGEEDNMENVVEYSQTLKTQLPPSVRVAYLHGKMKPAIKNQIMEQFGEKQIDVLVSTTVIEVGINVPNATVMLVENAERFGLAQLHQLRGRVGRGDAQSYCIFVSSSEKKETMQRLEILNKSNDGFEIASEDLKMRGPGDLFGIRQSGAMNFKIADIYQDALGLSQASECVDKLLTEDPNLERMEHQDCKQYLELALTRAVDFSTL